MTRARMPTWGSPSSAPGQAAEGRGHLERALALGRPAQRFAGRWAGVELALARLCEAESDAECARLHYARGLSERPDDDAARGRLKSSHLETRGRACAKRAFAEEN